MIPPAMILFGTKKHSIAKAAIDAPKNRKTNLLTTVLINSEVILNFVSSICIPPDKIITIFGKNQKNLKNRNDFDDTILRASFLDDHL